MGKFLDFLEFLRLNSIKPSRPFSQRILSKHSLHEPLDTQATERSFHLQQRPTVTPPPMFTYSKASCHPSTPQRFTGLSARPPISSPHQIQTGHTMYSPPTNARGVLSFSLPPLPTYPFHFLYNWQITNCIHTPSLCPPRLPTLFMGGSALFSVRNI